VSLQGGSQLKTRLRALKLAFKPYGRKWGTTVADIAKPKVPNRTGRLRKSIRLRNATQRKATVVGHYTAYFVDAGPKRHSIAPKRGRGLIFTAGGRTIFTKKVNHPGYRGRPFRASAAHEALRRHPLSEGLIDAWNDAA
jgi:hypothetical protein